MSCLTRDMQKQLMKYIKRHFKNPLQTEVAEIRSTLVQQGICPSDVTVDQLSIIMEDMHKT